MTYNFDPDRWYDDQRRLLDLRRQDGTLDEAAYQQALAEVERRYESMLARLDGTYQLKKDSGIGSRDSGQPRLPDARDPHSGFLNPDS